MSALTFPVVSSRDCTEANKVESHGNRLENHAVRIEKLEEGQKDLVGEFRAYRTEQSSREFKTTLFNYGQLFALIGGMAAILWVVLKK